MRVHEMVLLVACLLVAPAAQDEAGKKDLAKMQGTWKMVAQERHGEKLPLESIKNYSLIIKDDKYIWSGSEHTFIIDPTKKPKTIDIQGKKNFRGNGKSLGIYKLEGDTLTVCVNRSGLEKRATDFSTKDDHAKDDYSPYSPILFVYKREKP